MSPQTWCCDSTVSIGLTRLSFMIFALRIVSSSRTATARKSLRCSFAVTFSAKNLFTPLSFGCSYIFFWQPGSAVLFTLSSPFSCLAFRPAYFRFANALFWDFSFSYSLVSGYSILEKPGLVNRFFKLFWKNFCISYKVAAYDYFAGINGRDAGRLLKRAGGRHDEKTGIWWFLLIRSWL